MTLGGPLKCLICFFSTFLCINWYIWEFNILNNNLRLAYLIFIIENALIMLHMKNSNFVGTTNYNIHRPTPTPQTFEPYRLVLYMNKTYFVCDLLIRTPKNSKVWIFHEAFLSYSEESNQCLWHIKSKHVKKDSHINIQENWITSPHTSTHTHTHTHTLKKKKQMLRRRHRTHVE